MSRVRTRGQRVPDQGHQVLSQDQQVPNKDLRPEGFESRQTSIKWRLTGSDQVQIKSQTKIRLTSLKTWQISSPVKTMKLSKVLSQVRTNKTQMKIKDQPAFDTLSGPASLEYSQGEIQYRKWVSVSEHRAAFSDLNSLLEIRFSAALHSLSVTLLCCRCVFVMLQRSLALTHSSVVCCSSPLFLLSSLPALSCPPPSLWLMSLMILK